MEHLKSYGIEFGIFHFGIMSDRKYITYLKLIP